MVTDVGDDGSQSLCDAAQVFFCTIPVEQNFVARNELPDRTVQPVIGR
ncbi:hypothetical protein IMCC9480_1926 [Oxalobacteraceae bacterium IMCC9480]|nr:hypothetical protein IMCC9480_1926 [Oxalobacteraceae bacterium IMCC9480]